jgi:hypothetical protein
MNRVIELIAHWRETADTLASHGANQAAVTCMLHASELEAALRAHDEELLDLATAATESGYSADRLRHMIAEGTIANAGRKGAPRVRRSDLPRRKTSSKGFDAAAAAQRLVMR